MSEARSRIQQLESIVKGLTQLIEEREKQIAAISGQLKVAGVAVAPAAVPAPAGGVAVPPAPALAGGMPVPPAPAPAPAPAASATPSEATPPLGAAAATMLPEPTRRVPLPPPPEPEPDPWYMDPIVLGVAGAVGVAVPLLGLLVMRRRSAMGTGRRRASTGRVANAR
jgi:pilus assembly protein FimV